MILSFGITVKRLHSTMIFYLIHFTHTIWFRGNRFHSSQLLCRSIFKLISLTLCCVKWNANENELEKEANVYRSKSQTAHFSGSRKRDTA